MSAFLTGCLDLFMDIFNFVCGMDFFDFLLVFLACLLCLILLILLLLFLYGANEP